VSATSISTLVLDINKSFADCKLQQFLSATLAYWDDNCSTVGLFSTFPGLIWNLQFNSSSSLFASSTYVQATTPIFSSWEELVDILSACSLSVGMPSVTFVASNATPDLLPQQLSSVYPNILPAITFPIGMHKHDSNIAMLLSSQIMAENVQLLSQNANLTFAGELDTVLLGNIVFVAGLPPTGGGTNISLITCFNATNQPAQYLVPPSPNNTFVLTVRAELRTLQLQVIPLQISQQIILTPGALALTALSDAVSQLPPIIQPLLSVSIYPAIFPNSSYSFDQIRISLTRYMPNSSSWVVPLSLAISDSTFPYLTTATLAPATVMMLTEGLTLYASTTLASNNSSPISAAGSIGVLNVNFNQISGGGNVNLALSTRNQYQSMLSLAVAVAADIFSQFSINFDVSIQLQASGLSVEYAAEAPEGSPVPFLILGTWELAAPVDVTNMLLQLQKWNISLDQPFLVNAQQIERQVICSWATLLQQKLFQIVNYKGLATSPLPFISMSLGAQFQNGLGVAIANVQNQICQSTEVLTISTLCNTLKQIIGFNPCSNLQLDVRIVLDIDIIAYNVSYTTAFRLDTKSIFGGNIPFAVGLSDSISFNSYFDLNVKFDISLDIGTSSSSCPRLLSTCINKLFY
jgi:hypothetical protein